LIQKTDPSLCLMTPSYPEQDRTVVDAILLIRDKPLTSTEISRDATSPVQESDVCRLLRHQSRHSIGWIGLREVASGGESLQRGIERERRKGNRIIVFDAASRQDLANIADVAFRTEKKPLFVGSAGLAREVARKLASSASGSPRPPKRETRPLGHILVVSGSASRVTHQQIRHLRGKNIPEFILSQTWLASGGPGLEAEREGLSKTIADSLSHGRAVLTSPTEFVPEDLTGSSIHLKLRVMLASLALSALEKSQLRPHEIALILTGGDTAMSVLRLLQTEGIEIEEELLEGMMRGRLIGGRWEGLTVVTKAGAFGKEEAIENIMEILKRGSTSEEGRDESVDQR